MPEAILVLASHNAGKLAEMESLLKPCGIKVQSARGLGFNEQVEENGASFLENAALKAQAIAQALNLPALADDSGLCVAALQGAPGVFSARYAGENASDEQNNLKLLQAMQGQKQRDAYFACAMVCALPFGSQLHASGRLLGRIALTMRGHNGFGYDPLFEIPGTNKTLAQFDQAYKNKISHRARALAGLLKDLPRFLEAIS